MAKDLYVKARLDGGIITAPAVLSGPLQTQARLGQTVKEYVHDPEYEGAYTVTPSETAQTLETEGLSMTDDVTVEAIPDSYVGSGVPVRGPSDLYSAGAFVYAPAGYYPNLAAQSVDISTSLPKPAISVNNAGLITATEEITDSAFFQRGLSAERTKQLTQQRGKTVTPSDVEQTAVAAGRYTVGEVKVAPIPYTKHEIYFGFADETSVTIPLYCSDAVLTEIITGYTPTTYGGKEVILAQLDGVTWYSATGYTTLYEGTPAFYTDAGNYFWIPELANVQPTVGSEWRITINGTEYNCVAQNSFAGVTVGNPVHVGGADDGSGVPVAFYNYNHQAWSGDTTVLSAGDYTVKIERRGTA